MRRLHLFLLATAFLLGIVWNIQAQNFAVEFFGNVDDHVTAPDSDSLDIDGKAFTMEAWVFPTEIRDPEGIVINKEDSYEMAVWKGELKWAIAAPRWAWFGGGPVELNKWSHIAVTYDGDISMGWVNGKKVSEDKQNKGNIIPRDGDASPFSVGWRAWGHHGPFSGIIDEVRVSDTVRYTKDFDVPEKEFEPDKNTRVLYHFNEGTGKKTKDFSGNKNEAELIGGVKWVTSDVPIKPASVSIPDKLATTWCLIKSQ